jgi:cytoskeletal protein RodZ
MWRYLVGLVAGVLLVAGGVLWWRNVAVAEHVLPAAPLAETASASVQEPTPEPPQASEKTREERRFSRYDRDKNGAVGLDEYTKLRRTNFNKLDVNGDGRLSFDEYAATSITRFRKADADRSGALVPVEFAATRIARKPARTARCPPATAEES